MENVDEIKIKLDSLVDGDLLTKFIKKQKYYFKFSIHNFYRSCVNNYWNYLMDIDLTTYNDKFDF